MPNRTDYLVKSIGVSETTASAVHKVTPREFLVWAKQDLASSGMRGRGNALSNVKKALHARLDEIIRRTHIPFAKDWNPRSVSTEQKLDIIRTLGIGHESIVDLITLIRNNYEHEFVVPEFREVKAYLHAAELWLENSYKSYDTPTLGFVNLPLQRLYLDSRKPNGSAIKEVKFVKPEKVLCFLNSRKMLVTIHVDGTTEEKQFRSFTKDEMLRLEAPYIRRSRAETFHTVLDEGSLADLLERYRLWLKETIGESAQRKDT